MDNVWFNGWEPILRILVVGISAYLALIMLLRASGKRSLSRLNAYDFIITMALGSILAKIILTRDISISEGVAASALLILLQFLMSLASTRSRFVHRLLTSPPIILFSGDEYDRRALRRERISEHDLLEAAHQKGLADLDQVEVIILASTGQLHVVLKQPLGGAE